LKFIVVVKFQKPCGYKKGPHAPLDCHVSV
jgi:hypothetical protein